MMQHGFIIITLTEMLPTIDSMMSSTAPPLQYLTCARGGLHEDERLNLVCL
jgi:hypothetical protein